MYPTPEYLDHKLFSLNLWMFGNSCMEKIIIIKIFHFHIINIWEVKHLPLVKRMLFGLFMDNLLNRDPPQSVWLEMPWIHQVKLLMIKCQIMMVLIENFNHWEKEKYSFMTVKKDVLHMIILLVNLKDIGKS